MPDKNKQKSKENRKMGSRLFRAFSVKCAGLNINVSRKISVFSPLRISSSVTKLKIFEPDYLDVSSIFIFSNLYFIFILSC